MSNRISRKNLIKHVVKNYGYDEQDVDAIMWAITSSIAEMLAESKRVSICNFGAFNLKVRTKSREYVEIDTGARQLAPPRAYIRFSPSKKLLSTVRGGQHVEA